MDAKIWFVILAGGAVTYLIRLSFIVLLERIRVPQWFSRGLRYVPPAVLSAIILPELANWNGQAVNLSPANPQLVAGAAAALAAWRTRSVVVTLAVGFAVYLLLRAWLGGGS